jgi:tetratricopeptide (TPR) repeat protein
LDPKYAQAYASLGFTYILDSGSQWSLDPHLEDRAFQLEQHALALDPSNALAYLALSTLYSNEGQRDKSIAAAERAVAVDPSSSWGYALLAMDLAPEKPAEALKVLEKARRVDPRMLDSSLCVLAQGDVYIFMGRLEEAIPVLKRFVSLEPDLIIAHQLLAFSFIELGRDSDARAEAVEVFRISPQFILPHPPKGAERRDADLRKAGLK